MIDPTELKVTVLRAPDQGGQHVGWSYNTLRVEHIPSATVVELTGRSQHKTRAVAIEMIEWAIASNALLLV